MELNTLIIFLPIAFGIHNAEEVLGMEKWTNEIPAIIHKPVTTLQFGIAVFIFSILGFLVAYYPGLFPNEKYYYFVISGFSGMLLLNVFLHHIIATIYLKKYAPGVITAVLINLPLSLILLIQIKSDNLLSGQELISSLIVGGVVGVVFAFVLLKVGEIIAKIILK